MARQDSVFTYRVRTVKVGHEARAVDLFRGAGGFTNSETLTWTRKAARVQLNKKQEIAKELPRESSD